MHIYLKFTVGSNRKNEYNERERVQDTLSKFRKQIYIINQCNSQNTVNNDVLKCTSALVIDGKIFKAAAVNTVPTSGPKRNEQTAPAPPIDYTKYT